MHDPSAGHCIAGDRMRSGARPVEQALSRRAGARGGPGSKQHKINDWLPCPGVVLPGLVGCLDPA